VKQERLSDPIFHCESQQQTQEKGLKKNGIVMKSFVGHYSGKTN
jgi:hypothetical protein